MRQIFATDLTPSLRRATGGHSAAPSFAQKLPQQAVCGVIVPAQRRGGDRPSRCGPSVP